ncbi:MarR family transcriptional regulator [Haloarchaeobius sp. DFWS5]|uniref:helix-turn-helix transcriptional regulator n=1 Tax=Haloarchaeobius sp. DFWS5 TaxID=3446114 RepID=UPI003EBEDB23
MLGEVELEILATVERGDTVSDLAAELDHSDSYVSRAVADLSEKGLIYTERDGRWKRVDVSNARAIEIYQDLVRQHSHIGFAELLTGKTLEVLYYFDEPATVTELAAASDNYRNTVNRIMKRLRDRGLVGVDDGQYDYNGDFDQLHEFARELVHHLHRQQLIALAPSGTILWESYDEFLVQADSEIEVDHFHETGLARFAAFDLQFLLTSHRYYFYSEHIDAVTPADLCCHTLLIDDDTRYRTYCLLLLSHTDVDEESLREKAAKYGVVDTVEALLQYLDTAGEVANVRLPAWSEFQETAADYEVQLPT